MVSADRHGEKYAGPESKGWETAQKSFHGFPLRRAKIQQTDKLLFALWEATPKGRRNELPSRGLLRNVA